MVNVRKSRPRSECDQAGFSLLELLVAITITALLSTAVIASFQMGIRSWRRGEDFMDRSQRLSAATELIEKQIGSMNPLFPVSKPEVIPTPGRPAPVETHDTPAFVGGPKEMVFVCNYPLTSRGQGGLQVIHYSVGAPTNSSGSSPSVSTSSSQSASSSGLELRVTAAAIFHRNDFQNIAQATSQSLPDALVLLESIQDVSFHYWGEEENPPGVQGQPTMPRIVAFDEWNSEKRGKLPEAVGITIRFLQPSDSSVGKRSYNQDSVDLLIPINVTKAD
jgi:prepilin-type N-terminal cleavage/methylation domain-containing protein